LCKGPLGQLHNHFLPTHKLESKRRRKKRIIRLYGPARTPYERVLQSQEVSAQKRHELEQTHHRLNPFQLARDIERHKKEINQQRLLHA
jgi:hypothetical protein